MGVREILISSRSVFATVLLLVLLPQGASALPGAGETNAQAQMQSPSSSGLYNPALLFAPNIEWAMADPRTTPAWTFAVSRYRSLAATAPVIDRANSVAFDIGSYDAMWDDSLFSEIAAYGGLARDLQRVSNMAAMGGSDGTSIPYGRLTLQREFREGQHRLMLGAYGLHVSVRPTAISAFGDDSYTDVAVDGTYQWIAHPERSRSDVVSAHILILHEGENLTASHAVFGTRSADDLTVFRGDVTYSWGAAVTPAIQYFQITGSSDPVRLGTPDGIPDSNGWIAELDYAPPRKPDSPLNRFNVRLALQFIAYSHFDGSSRNASENNTVLLHVSAGVAPDA